MVGKQDVKEPEQKIEIGVQEHKPVQPGPVVPGPAVEYGEEGGGEGGVPYQVFAYRPEQIRRVRVWYREVVDGIQLETESGVLPLIGGTGKHRDIREEGFELEAGEHLTGVTIEYRQYIERITFHTNERNYGPYGGPGGRLKKSLRAPPGRVVAGFKGRHWEVIDSIQLMIW